MKNKITLTKQDVKNVAETLMKINGTTTTLDVKKELRDNDYHATQEIVANFMYEILDETDWAFSFNGTHRTYYLNENAASDANEDQDDDNTFTVKANLANSDFWKNKDIDLDDDEEENEDNFSKDLNNTDSDNILKLRTGKTIIALDSNNLPSCYWKVSSSITTRIFYFSNDLNREEVRYAYYKLAEIDKGSNYLAEKINFS